jgi:tRNA(1-methyladenosine) methyltransferase and related methyltransferases
LGRLLFRLVNYFKCKSVLHVGSGSGMLIPYLLTPFADCKGVVLGQGEELILTTEKMKERLGLKNVEFYSDDYMDILNGFIAQSFKFDIIFIDLMDPDITVELIWMCLKCIHGHTILVIRGIRRNKKMKMMWKRLRENSICVISLDLYTLGIVFFDNKMYKRHYKMHF